MYRVQKIREEEKLHRLAEQKRREALQPVKKRKNPSQRLAKFRSTLAYQRGKGPKIQVDEEPKEDEDEVIDSKS